MTRENLEKEFEIRKLKEQNKQLLNTNTLLNRQNKILNENLDKRVEKEVKGKMNFLEKETRRLARIVKIKEDLEQRQAKKLKEKDEIIHDKNNQIEALVAKIKELTKEKEELQKEKDKANAKMNLDGNTAGISTSKTPINKKKIIPSTREKSDKTVGGQVGHAKHKLEKFREEEVNETKEIELKECPHCHSKQIVDLNTAVTKDELDYEIKIIKRRHYFKEYECKECHKKVRANIPNRLKEENQYGECVQAHALSLTNIANVPFNKTRRIIFGLTNNEINLSEGYIAKLQKRASDLLNDFVKELNEYIRTLKVVHWDDTVIFVDGKRACLRFYGDNNIALYTAHEKKNKLGIIEDDLLNNLSSNTVVMHDHTTVNYGEEFIYINVECCAHLERDLEKVKLNIPESTWSINLKELFSGYNHKRNEYLKKEIESFSLEEINDFFIKFDENILLGIEENKQHGKTHYYTEEKAILNRLLEYRDNYTYWLFDFSIPYTNNTAERGLRIVKTKMKVSGQFKNIENAKYYANIKSYTETCHRNGINEVEALTRLLNDTPFTVQEIIEYEQNKKEV